MRPVAFSAIILPAIFALYACPTQAATIHVPADYRTIQGAIDVAVDGDLVLVSPGMYVENIDFLGKAITVRSKRGANATIIDGSQAGSVVTFYSGETEEAVIDSFMITNGSGNYIGSCTYGGGIYCNDQSSPTITNCKILENSATVGGGIFCLRYSNATITNCTIFGNSAEDEGGGIQTQDSNPTITNCTISGNVSYWQGGGIFAIEYEPPDGLDPVITNCIVWGNYGNGIYVYRGSVTVAYSDVQGGWPGEGNIAVNPHFVGGVTYHLRLGSPCVDSGTDAGIYTDMDGQRRPWGAGFDMGADEFSTEPCSVIASSGGQFLALYLIPVLAFFFLSRRWMTKK